MVRLLSRSNTDGAPRYVAEREGTLAAGRRRHLRHVPRGRGDRSARALTLLAPVTPSKIVCVGLNYKDHAAEQQQAAAGGAAAVHQAVDGGDRPGRADSKLPAWAGRVDHEAELGVVIGNGRASRCARTARTDYILGLIGGQRRHRARPAEQGRAVHALQGLRHVRADRAVHRGRARRPRSAGARRTSTATCGRTRGRAS